MTNIGNIIAKLRMENGLKQNKLSSLLCMSPSNVSNYENGNYWPDLATLCKIADLFHVTTDFLLGRTGYRCPPEILDQYLTPDYKLYHIINTLLSLETNSLDTVTKFVNYLKAEEAAPQRDGFSPCRPVR